MPRLQDILFGIWGLALLILITFQMGIAVLALLGALLCGSIYLFAGMLPPGDQGFFQRASTTTFLAIVLASLVLIAPGTLGKAYPDLRTPVLVIAGLLPLTAIVFEVLRTPRILQGILRYLGPR
jgi:hypothetical protein